MKKVNNNFKNNLVMKVCIGNLQTFSFKNLNKKTYGFRLTSFE